MELSFSASADRNKAAVGDALADRLMSASRVVEIGSGTGQHAVYLAQRFDHLQWQPTDRAENLSAISQRIAQYGSSNILPPVELDVALPVTLPERHYDIMYSANTAHIMRLAEVERMFAVAGNLLASGGAFALYGPFQHHGQHNAPGNRQFDQQLKQQAPHMGVRDKLDLARFAARSQLLAEQELAMPSNNQILIWRRR